MANHFDVEFGRREARKMGHNAGAASVVPHFSGFYTEVMNIKNPFRRMTDGRNN
jgi:hypothetical protein